MKEKKKKQCVNVNIDVENNRAIGYHYDSLDDPIGDSDGNVEDYLMKPWERIGF